MIVKKKKKGYKLKKVNYNNQLENILSKKMYKEDVKNLLLDSLYKIEISYNDYSNVKKNVLKKELYIQKFLYIIENYCDDIKFITFKTDENFNYDMYLINKENKEICCYPIGRKLIYCISEIKKSDNIIKTNNELLDKSLTNLLNIGNNINMVEPLRDFNGFSWNVCIDEIENIYYNLIYQDLIILVGNSFLEQWVNKNECMIDYIELFKVELERKYGLKITNKIIQILERLSILIEFDLDENLKKDCLKEKNYLKHQLEKMDYKEKYLENMSECKKEVEKEIKNIDLVLNNKNLLQEKYIKLNQDLPLEKKIFSARQLAKRLLKERDFLIKKLENYNELMNPYKFRQNKQNMEDKYKYLVLSEIQDLKKEIFKNLILLQKEVIKALSYNISKTNDKNELQKIIYEIRYLCLLPISKNKLVKDCPELSKMMDKLKTDILVKSIEQKVIINISSGNVNILKNIFNLKIINLENIYMKIIETEEKLYIQFYDEDIADEKFELVNVKKDDLKIKTDKMIKIFI